MHADRRPPQSAPPESAPVPDPARKTPLGGPQDATRRDELAEALANGPFSDALRLAIEVNGLSLDRLQRRLADRGVRVSLTTLSYWRHGRSRPERPDSLRGVGILEEVLGLPERSLIGLLGPRRPRGRWVTRGHGTVDLDQLWTEPETIRQLRAHIDLPPPNQLSPVSVQDVVLVGSQRDERAVRTRMVMEAAVGGVFRSFLVYRTEPERAVAITATRHCTLGTVIHDPSGFMIAELVLDRTLAEGETTIFEYEVVAQPGEPILYHDRRFVMPTRQYVLQVEFQPDMLPARCVRYHRPNADSEPQGVHEVAIGASHTAHVIELDMAPGIYGMRWDWPELG
ncbi:hypothetical protein [Actinoalloteichus hymeniacidonis]|uniref:Uncharacterized protein n=1 Tax=Actinoalloteichus hymeniacidonis TaxID=340345 RepID=A0AAC9HN79_9PSEU|nr:hypothetical protein [Actinoalloteichus hymeniacidonis]AOS62404.1 hypothetical protein TL08_07935 [Actinoalloteichus hymeniacidonis]MBB5909565.1 hypothetical protein [Actinoalloteichus hymeniacidonis]